jgi:hypothetical protein
MKTSSTGFGPADRARDRPVGQRGLILSRAVATCKDASTYSISSAWSWRQNIGKEQLID